MTKIYTLEQIKQAVVALDFSDEIEAGFVAYSNGQVVVPPVGELTFEDPPGDTHIKYGYIKGDDCYVIKIASGFYQNARFNLPTGSGLMLVFSQQTGALQTILLDEGYLTNIRTAVAGEIVARYMAPREVTAIGVFGTGTMARMQVQFLKSVTDCRRVVVWGRSDASLAAYRDDMLRDGYDVQTTRDAAEVADASNLIVTTTASVTPLLQAAQVKPGTHITAMGSDTLEKQELDTQILRRADIVVVDSLSQSRERGEVYQASMSGDLNMDEVIELGGAIAGGKRIRTSDEQITVADLTGVAVQDIQIAKVVGAALGAG